MSGNFQIQYVTREGKQLQKFVADDIEPASFRAFLKYLYTDKLDGTVENIMGVLHAGERFDASVKYLI